MPWGLIAGVAISAISAYAQSRANDRQNDSQLAWNQYNAQSQYAIAQGNIASQMAIGQFNAAMAMQAGRISGQVSMASALINAKVIRATTDYNDELLAAEEDQLWDSLELDTKLLHNARAVERGQIEAFQAASGTVMGEGSNADVVMDQQLQEALDLFVIQRGADYKAADIANARAQGEWEGEMQIKKVLWEGQLAATAAQANAGLQAMGSLATSGLSALAGQQSARIQYNAGMAGAGIQYDQNSMQNRAQLTQGLFGAAANGVQAYYNGRSVNGGGGASGRVYYDGRGTFDSMSNAGASLAASN